jgi:hypothetical protein
MKTPHSILITLAALGVTGLVISGCAGVIGAYPSLYKPKTEKGAMCKMECSKAMSACKGSSYTCDEASSACTAACKDLDRLAK